MTNFFDESAATWDDDPRRAVRAQEVAQAIRSAIPLDRAWSACEYGAGTGLLGRALSPDLAHITLADSSAGMIEMATRRIMEAGLGERMRAIRLDLTRDPIPGERFDLVFSQLALHHVPDTAQILGALAAILRPGGWIAIADLDSDGGLYHRHHHGPVHDGFGRDEFGTALAAAGFEGIAVSTAGTVTKQIDGQAHDFGMFLATARRPGDAGHQ